MAMEGAGVVGRLRRWTAAFQLEDLLLFVWFALGEPALERLLRAFLPADLPAALASQARPQFGIGLLASAAAAVVCLATRDASERQMVGRPGWLTPNTYARLPMLVVLALLAEHGFEQLGSGAGERLFPWIVAFVGATLLLQPWLPAAPYPLRRLLMLPTIAVGALMFGGTMESLFSGGDLSGLLEGADAAARATARFGLLIVTIGSLVYYVLFVFAPRQVAAAGGSWIVWLARYLLFLSALAGGMIWGPAVTSS